MILEVRRHVCSRRCWGRGRLGWPGERKSIGATSRSKCRFSKSPDKHLAQRNQLVKAWAQLPGAGPRAWGPKPQGLGAAWLAGRAPRPKTEPQFFVVLKSLGRGLAKGWESAE